MSFENIQVIDVGSLNLPSDMYDDIADFYGISNGSYHRYYPSNDWEYIKAPIKDMMNKKLLNIGVEIEYDLHFYVLLHFSW